MQNTPYFRTWMPSGQTHSRIFTNLAQSATIPHLIFLLRLEKNATVKAAQWKLLWGLRSPLSTLASGINLLAWHESLSPSARLNVNLRNAETPLVMSALLEQANST